MIVEDNQHIRKLYKEILISKGYDIIDAEDGEKAIHLYDSLDEKPEIIIVDYKMPKLNGLILTQKLLTRNPSSKILMISGDPSVNKEDAMKWRIRFRAKPVKIDDILSEINRFIEPHNPEFVGLNFDSISYRVEDIFSMISDRNGFIIWEDDIGYILKM
ncbi:MAG: response regulator [Candidatus Heimdallarchaeota archaeon]